MKSWREWLPKKTKTEQQIQDELRDEIFRFSVGVMTLEMTKDQYIEMNPIVKGQCGPFRLTGQSRPEIEYIMFEKSLMEFVRVKAVLQHNPPGMSTWAYIESQLTDDPKNHGKPINDHVKYLEPLRALIKYCGGTYFPYCSAKVMRAEDKIRADRTLMREEYFRLINSIPDVKPGMDCVKYAKEIGVPNESALLHPSGS